MHSVLGSISWDDIEELGKLGSGASASVKKIRNKKDGKLYAMKVMAMDKNEQKEKTITSEVKALLEINSENIIRMYEAFFKDGCINLIIEFMDCGSLEDIIKTTGPIPEPILSQMTEMMLKGLEHMQDLHIVHRDLKPANILCNHQGIVKIADFGMAGQKASHDQWTTFQGTFTYMSPERIKGGIHDYTSDIWSIGLTVATCALGKFPFELKENTIWEMMKYLESGSILEHLGGLSEEMKDFVKACMEFDPKKRPNAKALLEFDWIKKYHGSKKEHSIEHWLYYQYILVKKKQKEQYLQQQQKGTK
jgi:serine/threonine protein kinase